MNLSISGSEWKAKAQDAIATLRTLDPDQFYDGSEYHEVRKDLSFLIKSFDLSAEEIGEFSNFLEVHPGSKGWLPLEVDVLGQMESGEIRFRFMQNISGERWVDGCLVKPFLHGTLVGALELLLRDIENQTLSNA